MLSTIYKWPTADAAVSVCVRLCVYVWHRWCARALVYPSTRVLNFQLRVFSSSFLFLKWTLHALFYPSRFLSIRFSIEYRIIRNACRYWLWEYQISGRLVIQIQRPLANGWWVRGGDMGFHRKFLLMKPKRRWRYENIIVPLSLANDLWPYVRVLPAALVYTFD